LDKISIAGTECNEGQDVSKQLGGAILPWWRINTNDVNHCKCGRRDRS